MQLTFTIGRDTTPAEYHRLIAALVVLGEVRAEDVPEEWRPATPERILSDIEAARAAMRVEQPEPKSLPEPGKSPMLPTSGELLTPEEETAGTFSDRLLTPSGLKAAMTESPFTPAELAEADRLVAEQTAASADRAVTETSAALRDDTAGLGFGQPAPPPPPPFSAPPPPPVPDAPADVDKSGVRWDARIHAGTRTKLANGDWKAKRGVEPALVEQVLAEQRHTGALTPQAPPPPPVPEAGPAPTDAASLIAWITSRGIESEVIEAACVTIGLVDANGKGSLPLILSRQDFVPALHAELSK